MTLFHVHTYRCKHAGDEKDEAYILKAIEMGADEITFTAHGGAGAYMGSAVGNKIRRSAVKFAGLDAGAMEFNRDSQRWQQKNPGSESGYIQYQKDKGAAFFMS